MAKRRGSTPDGESGEQGIGSPDESAAVDSAGASDPEARPNVPEATESSADFSPWPKSDRLDSDPPVAEGQSTERAEGGIDEPQAGAPAEFPAYSRQDALVGEDAFAERPDETPAETVSPETYAAETYAAEAPQAEPVYAAPMADASDDVRHEEHEEDAGPSVAARVLTLLLAVLAGAGFGIWAAPKLAPQLPAGMAPVADWLMPGQRDVDAKLAQLQASFDSRIADVDARLAALPAADSIEGRIGAAVAASEAKVSAEIQRLSDSVDAAGGTNAREQLARLEAAISGQEAELTALKDQLASTGAVGGQASDETQRSIDVYRAELEGLRAEMATLRDGVSGFSSRIDQVEASADRQVQVAQEKVNEVEAEAEARSSAAEIDADLAQIRGALASGQPFAQPLSKLASQPDVQVPASLSAAADSGVSTLSALRDSFPEAAHDAIRASIRASSGEGVLARARAYVEAQVASRSLTPQTGDATDAILSRMEDRLRADDLAGALAEAEALPSEAAAAMSSWLDAARSRAGAVEAFGTLSTALSQTTN